MSKLILEIHNPLENSQEKFTKALYTLGKALKADIVLEHEDHSEPTPYRAVQELTDRTEQFVEDKLLQLFKLITQKWLRVKLEKAVRGSAIFKLNGKIYIDPRTRKPLTVAEWALLQKDLTRIFSWLYGQSQEAITKQAIAVGKLLQRMDPDKRLTVKQRDLKIDPVVETITQAKLYSNVIDWAQIHTGELIVDLTDRSRRSIVDTIMQGYQDKLSPAQLQSKLFDDFADMNRDWRRIAETEIATNFNNGYLVSELETAEPEEPIFMIGITGAGACGFCQTEIDGRIVVLLSGPPSGGGEKVTIEGKEYVAIWPGKSNMGRKRVDWWVAAGSQHPHCRCSWTRYDLAFEEYETKLRTALNI